MSRLAELLPVRRGVLGCFSPVRPETAARSRTLTDWFPGRLTNGNPRAPIDRIPKSVPRQHTPEESGERIS